jgi:putative Mg2+ transporter-C (MgtC) family protein
MDILHELYTRYGPQTDMALFTAQTVTRLILAGVLGGIIGLEREYRRKAAGLRTNMFICFGSALFTILSWKLAQDFPGDHTRIAAQIIPGIGFIGAGSILHARGSVSGLTTASTMFVVASIGMAAGGGLYATAILASLLLLIALTSLGYVEKKLNLKDVPMLYEIQGSSPEQLVASVNGVLEESRHIMQSVQIGRTNSHYRVQFTVTATNGQHQELLKNLRQIPYASRVECLGVTTDRE